MLEPQAYRNSVSNAVHASSRFDADRFACGVKRTDKYYPCVALPTCHACVVAGRVMPVDGFVPIAELVKYLQATHTSRP